MKLPCEKAIWYIVPNIRADLTREMARQGMSQKDIAKKLGITPPAVSQYLHRKRGGKTRTSEKYKKTILKTADDIEKLEDENAISAAICRCCSKVRQKMA